jgi:hypothetical protein
MSSNSITRDAASGYFDVVARRDLVLVWLVEERDSAGVLNLIAVEHAA